MAPNDSTWNVIQMRTIAYTNITSFLALFFFVCWSHADGTIKGVDFYGTWATTSSIATPKRQIFNISPKGGSWIRIDDQGNEDTIALKESDILINDDLLIVDYTDQKSGWRAKHVLGGWNRGKYKAIFGTVFMYSGNELDLFNGLPISFRNGTEHLPPQEVWAFFSNPGILKSEPGSIATLAQALEAIAGVEISETETTKDFLFSKFRAVISFSKEGNKIHPSVVGLWPSRRNPAEIEFAGRFENDRGAFQDYYMEFQEDANRIKAETAQQLMEHIENLSSEK